VFPFRNERHATSDGIVNNTAATKSLTLNFTETCGARSKLAQSGPTKRIGDSPNQLAGRVNAASAKYGSVDAKIGLEYSPSASSIQAKSCLVEVGQLIVVSLDFKPAKKEWDEPVSDSILMIKSNLDLEKCSG
jgi:hypothetical protein